MADNSIPNITLHNGQPVTTSLDVADRFGKNHQHVLRDIRRILETAPEGFSLSNFGQSSYLSDRKQSQPMYYITKDGFALMAMGFTGQEALTWKINYITAFNRMETELRYRELARMDRQDRMLEILQSRLDHMEAALFADHPAWPVIAKAKELGLTHRQTCEHTGHRSTSTIRRNMLRMESYGISTFNNLVLGSMTTH